MLHMVCESGCSEA